MTAGTSSTGARPQLSFTSSTERSWYGTETHVQAKIDEENGQIVISRVTQNIFQRWLTGGNSVARQEIITARAMVYGHPERGGILRAEKNNLIAAESAALQTLTDGLKNSNDLTAVFKTLAEGIPEAVVRALSRTNEVGSAVISPSTTRIEPTSSNIRDTVSTQVIKLQRKGTLLEHYPTIQNKLYQMAATLSNLSAQLSVPYVPDLVASISAQIEDNAQYLRELEGMDESQLLVIELAESGRKHLNELEERAGHLPETVGLRSAILDEVHELQSRQISSTDPIEPILSWHEQMNLLDSNLSTLERSIR